MIYYITIVGLPIMSFFQATFLGFLSHRGTPILIIQLFLSDFPWNKRKIQRFSGIPPVMEPPIGFHLFISSSIRPSLRI
jgi:hypothetical protein